MRNPLGDGLYTTQTSTNSCTVNDGGGNMVNLTQHVTRQLDRVTSSHFNLNFEFFSVILYSLYCR